MKGLKSANRFSVARQTLEQPAMRITNFIKRWTNTAEIRLRGCRTGTFKKASLYLVLDISDEFGGAHSI